jgi:hypothetical protein
VIESLPLEVGQIELIGNQSVGDMLGELRMSGDRGEFPRPATLIGNPESIPYAESELRVVIEEERGDVVVVDEEQHIGLLFRQPTLDGRVGLEDRCPHRIALFVSIQRKADGRRV